MKALEQNKYRLWPLLLFVVWCFCGVSWASIESEDLRLRAKAFDENKEMVTPLLEMCQLQVIQERSVCDSLSKGKQIGFQKLSESKLRELFRFMDESMSDNQLFNALAKKKREQDLAGKKCVENYQSCANNPCCKGWVCALSAGKAGKEEAKRSCGSIGAECSDHGSCCSNRCLKDEGSDKGICQGSFICVKEVVTGEQCDPAQDTCKDASQGARCIDHNEDRGHLGFCKQVSQSCKKDSDCCSTSCQKGSCRPLYRCKKCSIQGEKIKGKEKCCEGLYPNMNKRCVPDIPPLPPQVLLQERIVPSAIVQFGQKIVEFFIPSAHAEDNGSSSSPQSVCKSEGKVWFKNQCISRKNYQCLQSGKRWHNDTCLNEQEYCDALQGDSTPAEYDSQNARCITDLREICENSIYEEGQQPGFWDGSQCVGGLISDNADAANERRENGGGPACGYDVNGDGTISAEEMSCESEEMNLNFNDVVSKKEFYDQTQSKLNNLISNFWVKGSSSDSCLFFTKYDVFNRMKPSEKVLQRFLEAFEFVAYNPSGLRDYYRQDYYPYNSPFPPEPLGMLTGENGMERRERGFNKNPAPPYTIETPDGAPAFVTSEQTGVTILSFTPNDFSHPEWSIKGRLHLIAKDLKKTRVKNDIQHAKTDRFRTCECISSVGYHSEELDPLVKEWAINKVEPRDMIFARVPAGPEDLRAAGYQVGDLTTKGVTNPEELENIYRQAMMKVLQQEGLVNNSGEGQQNCPGLVIEEQDKFGKAHKEALALESGYEVELRYLKQQREFLLEMLEYYTSLYDQIYSVQYYMGGIPEVDTGVSLVAEQELRDQGLADRNLATRGPRGGNLKYSVDGENNAAQNLGIDTSQGPWGWDVESRYWGLHNRTLINVEWWCHGGYPGNWFRADCIRAWAGNLIEWLGDLTNSGVFNAIMGVIVTGFISAAFPVVGLAFTIVGLDEYTDRIRNNRQITCQEHKSNWDTTRKRFFIRRKNVRKKRKVWNLCSGYQASPYCGLLLPPKMCVMSAYEIQENSVESQGNMPALMDHFTQGGFLIDPFIPYNLETSSGPAVETQGRLDNKHFLANNFSNKGIYKFKGKHITNLVAEAEKFIQENRILDFTYRPVLPEGVEQPGGTGGGERDQLVGEATNRFIEYILVYHFFTPAYSPAFVMNPAPSFIAYVDMLGWSLYSAARDLVQGGSISNLELQFVHTLSNYNEACGLARSSMTGGPIDYDQDLVNAQQIVENSGMAATAESLPCSDPKSGEYLPAYFQSSHEQLVQKRLSFLGSGINSNFTDYQGSLTGGSVGSGNSAAGSLSGGAAGNFGRRERLRKKEFDHYMKVRGNTSEGQRSIKARAQQLDRMMSPLGQDHRLGSAMYAKAKAVKGSWTSLQNSEEETKEENLQIKTVKARAVASIPKKKNKSAINADAAVEDFLSDLSLDIEGLGEEVILNEGNEVEAKTYIRMLEGSVSNRKAFEPTEDDTLFQVVTKAYVRNLPRILVRRKKLPEKKDAKQKSVHGKERSKLKSLLEDF